MANFITLIKKIDLLFCRYLQIVSPEKPALIVFNFHKIFKNKSDIIKSGVDPQQGTTLSDFKIFIEYFLSAGYEFIHPDNIPDKLDAARKYILITFDDGYFNNIYLLPLLKEYRIPSIFFIASNNVIKNEAFWWDVVYKLKAMGISLKEISLYKKKIKRMDPIRANEFLKTKLPDKLFKPTNDYDRPFNSEELKDFSNEQYVLIGNHTADHAVLTNCTLAEVKNQIEQAQIDLENITGKPPRFLSYPNGNYSNEIVDIVMKMNLKLAFTMDRRKNQLPITDKNNLLKISRFMISRVVDIKKDGMIFRSNYSFYNSGINFYTKLSTYL